MHGGLHVTNSSIKRRGKKKKKLFQIPSNLFLYQCRQGLKIHVANQQCDKRQDKTLILT